MQNPAVECMFGRNRPMVRNAVYDAFLNTNNGNDVPTRSGSFQTIGTARRLRSPFHVTPDQWRRDEFESGGHRSGAKVGAPIRAKK